MTKEQTPITAEDFCNRLDQEIGEAWSNDYENLPKYMEQYAQAKVLEALESKKECLHDWIDGYLGTEWIIECSKCERDLFDVYNQEDAVKILRNRSKTKV